MALIPEINPGLLIVRSVGDHDLETGFLQMTNCLVLAKGEFDTSGQKLDMLIDLSESEENKNPEELEKIAEFFRPHLGYLTGRMAVLVDKEVHYGLTRLFSVHGEQAGLTVMVSRSRANIDSWLKEPASAATEEE